MDLIGLARDLIALAFVQGVIAGLLVLAIVRAALYIVAARNVPRRPTERIRVIGVGGAGGNAVNAMIEAKTTGVDFIATNTDAQALRRSHAGKRVQLGREVVHGVGTGGDVSIAERSAHEDAETLSAALAGSDIVFVIAGLGGGTGSGAAPVVASIAKKQGALTIAVVTRPFGFEGGQRRAVADRAAEALRQNVDALITVPNDIVRESLPASASMQEAFQAVDEVIRRSVEGIIDIISIPGLINLDVAHVRAVMREGGTTVMGVGRATGDNRAVEAVRQAIAAGRFDHRLSGATGILLNVTGSSSLGLNEVTTAVEEVQALAAPDANVIFGASFDRRLRDEVVVTVIATGFDRTAARTPVRPTIAPRGRNGHPTRKPTEAVVVMPSERIVPLAADAQRPEPALVTPGDVLPGGPTDTIVIAPVDADPLDAVPPRRRIRLPAIRTNGS